ncbi:hypothetical protein D3C71_2017850 [compost metagenome]
MPMTSRPMVMYRASKGEFRRSASFGSRRGSQVFSRCTSTTIDTNASTTPAMFQRGSGDALPTLTASTATVSSSNCATGSLLVTAVLSRLRAGSTRQTSHT